MTGQIGGVAILTGERGSGKTTACLELLAQAREAGLDCAGLVCPAVFDAGVKVGIDATDVRTGERRRLASVDGLPGGLRLGPFRFDEASLAWGERRLELACPCDLLFVDEIGPLELERGQGWVRALDVLRSGRYGLAIVVVRPSLLDALRDRLGAGEVEAVATPAGGGGATAVAAATAGETAAELAALVARWAPSTKTAGR